MRCRRWFVGSWTLLALASCTRSEVHAPAIMSASYQSGAPQPAGIQTTEVKPSAPPVQMARSDQPKDEPKRTPKPATCVQGARCQEQKGDKTENPSVRQQCYELARKGYEQALEIDPNHQPAMVALARLYEKQGNYDQAVAMYQRGLSKDAESATIWFELGMCWARQKQWQESIDCLQKAASLEPNNTTYSKHVGWTMARAGREADSLEHFRKTSGDARANYQLALMMHHLKNTEKCCQYLEASLQADPHLQEAKDLLAKLESEHKQTTPDISAVQPAKAEVAVPPIISTDPKSTGQAPEFLPEPVRVTPVDEPALTTNPSSSLDKLPSFESEPAERVDP